MGSVLDLCHASYGLLESRYSSSHLFFGTNAMIGSADIFCRLHVQLMDLQQKQIDELADWLTVAEQRISSSEVIGSDLDTVRHQVEDHKVIVSCCLVQ